MIWFPHFLNMLQYCTFTKTAFLLVSFRTHHVSGSVLLQCPHSQKHISGESPPDSHWSGCAQQPLWQQAGGVPHIQAAVSSSTIKMRDSHSSAVNFILVVDNRKRAENFKLEVISVISSRDLWKNVTSLKGERGLKSGRGHLFIKEILKTSKYKWLNCKTVAFISKHTINRSTTTSL